MDPFSLATGLAGLVSLSLELIDRTSKYATTAAGAPQEIKELRIELQALAEVLKQLEQLLRSDSADDIEFAPDSALFMAKQNCEERLSKLFKKLRGKNSVQGDPVVHNERTSLLNRLVWPFQKEEIIENCTRLHECTQTFHFCLTIKNCKNLSRSTNDVLSELKKQKDSLTSAAAIMTTMSADVADQFRSTSDEIKAVISAISHTGNAIQSLTKQVDTLALRDRENRRQVILDWLSMANAEAQNEAARSRRLEGSCQKSLGSDTLRAWIDGTGSSPFLLCFGSPGAGKTVFCSALIDKLSSRIASSTSSGTGICYVYFEHQYQSMQTTVSILRGFLRQLLTQLDDTPPGIMEELDGYCRRGSSIDLTTTFKLLVSASTKFERIYLCIDALDECCSPTEILQKICELPACFRSSITSRAHMEPVVRRSIPQSEKLIIEAEEVDIRAALSFSIREAEKADPGLMDSSLENDIIEKLVSSANGIFLLPYLHLRNILACGTKKKRRDTLSTTSNTLNGAYDKTLERIKALGSDQYDRAMEIFAWMIHAQNPLHWKELRSALAVEIGEDAFDPDNMPSEHFESCCLGLVIREKEQPYTVRLVHLSLKEYFMTSMELDIGHDFIAQKCLTHLMPDWLAVIRETWALENARDAARPDNSIPARRFRSMTLEGLITEMIRHADFLGYAARHWGNHMRMAKPYSPRTLELALKFVLRTDMCEILITAAFYEPSSFQEPFTAPETGITIPRAQVLARFGLCEVLQRAAEAAPIILASPKNNTVDWRTPLEYAVINGHRDMVSMLISKYNCDVGEWADETYHLLCKYDLLGSETMSLLLEQATEEGDTISLKTIFENYDPQGAVLSRRTHHVQIKTCGEFLLAAVCLEVPIDTVSSFLDSYRIQLASTGSRLTLDEKGRHCLYYAKSPETMRLLLETMDISQTMLLVGDRDGQSPLHYIIQHGSPEAARLLVLEAKTMNILQQILEASNNDQLTPLEVAMRLDTHEMTKMLVSEMDVPEPWPGAMNDDGETPLHLAITLDNLGFAKSLFNEARSLNLCSRLLNAVDGCGRTPLLLLFNWHCPNQYAITELLLAEASNIGELSQVMLASDPYGMTLLHQAVRFDVLFDVSCPAVLIFHAKKADCDGQLLKAVNKNGQTPLNYLLRLEGIYPDPGVLKTAKLLVSQGAASMILIRDNTGTDSLDLVRGIVGKLDEIVGKLDETTSRFLADWKEFAESLKASVEPFTVSTSSGLVLD